MHKVLLLLSCYLFLAIASISGAEMPKATPAAPAATPAATKESDTSSASSRPLPFQGTVDSVDLKAKTFTIKTKAGKEHLYSLTESTKIVKDDAPATLADVKANGIVRGSRKKLGEGKWEAVKVIIGAKPDAVKKS